MAATQPNPLQPFIDMMNKTEYTFEMLKKANETPLPELQPQDLSGKVVVVTGANAGIGYETAKNLAKMNPQKLILACRSTKRGDEAKNTIEAETKHSNLEVWELDLSSLESVKRFAKKFNDSSLSLDILVSNAGVNADTWVETQDGYELTAQVNHIANVLLVLLLTPSLKRASSPRVEIVASDTHFWPHIPTEDDPTPVQTVLKKPEAYNRMVYYPASKLLNVLFAREYAKRCPHKNIWICSSNPGYTESELGSKDHSGEKLPPRHFHLIDKRTTYEGAKTIINCVIFPEANKENNGAYFSDMKASNSRSSTKGERGDKFGKNVWNDTMDILRKHVGHSEIEEWAWSK